MESFLLFLPFFTVWPVLGVEVPIARDVSALSVFGFNVICAVKGGWGRR